jgi:TolA-binding protein
VAIEKLQLRREGEQVNLHFLLSGPAPTEVVANLPKRVLVVKFGNARAAFPNDQRDFAFNDAMVVGVAFEDVPGGGTWAKVRLRTPELAFGKGAGGTANEVVVGFRPAPFPEGTRLSGIRLGEHRGGSRLVMDLSAVPAIEEGREGEVYRVRLRGVAPQLGQPGQVQDSRIAVTGIEADGPDTLVRVQLKRGGLQVSSLVLPAPPRVVVDFRPPGREQAVQAPAPAPAQPERPPRPASREISLETLLSQEKNPLLSANYLLAEREIRSGNYARANLLFLRVFDTAPTSLLGIRAFFRAADAQYEQRVAEGATNFHDVISTYQSAIRSAETRNYETELVPHAFFQIGRAYQQMGFHFESNVHYRILQDRFPDHDAFTPDSFYYEGLNFLAMDKYEEAASSFRTFLERDGDPGLVGPGRYHLGDAYFNLKRYVEARTEFDRGREISPNYADARPLLIFHMGETYYENADFDVARLFYQTLLDRYPDKSYTKLVGLRLGDFLREEGKEDEALKVYRQVVANAPLEIRLRGKMRIASVLGQRPVGEDEREALTLYEEVITEGEGLLVQQEALLRKGLTLTLHGINQEAIDTLAKLAVEHPQGPYTRDNLIRANIEENLKAMVDRLYQERKHWEVAKVYTRYRDAYFRRFRFPYATFQVAHAYQELGLYDEAIGLYDEMLRVGAGSLASLVKFQKARAYLEKDDLGKSEAQLLAFIAEHEGDPYLTDARMLLGKLNFIGRRYEEALKAYRILVVEFERTKEPRLGEAIAEVHFELGQIYKELGRNKEALDSYQEAIANFHHPIQGPSVPEFIKLSHFALGDMLFELGQDREALEAYEHAISLYGDHDRAPWARYQIGLIFRRGGEDEKALAAFNTLVELAKVRPGELWEALAKENQRDLAGKLEYRNYLKQ